MFAGLQIYIRYGRTWPHVRTILSRPEIEEIAKPKRYPKEDHAHVTRAPVSSLIRPEIEEGRKPNRCPLEGHMYPPGNPAAVLDLESIAFNRPLAAGAGGATASRALAAIAPKSLGLELLLVAGR